MSNLPPQPAVGDRVRREFTHRPGFKVVRDETVPLRTKWEILTAQRDFLLAHLADVTAQLDGAERQEWGFACSTCGTKLPTEADFAKHFVVPDERYLEIGYCHTHPRTLAELRTGAEAGL